MRHTVVSGISPKSMNFLWGKNEKRKALELAVVYQEIQQLLPYPRNARTHSKRQIRQIADSISAFGFTNPVLVDRSATIVAGHGRVQAANLLGIKRVPPSEARNTPTLLSLQPGVTYLGPRNGNSVNDARAGTTDGGRSDQANITLDGIDVNDINNGFAFTSVLRVSPDSVAEFRVITSNPNADQGRSSGAQVALVTKSGTNALHGALYEYNRSNLLEANDFFNQQLERSQDLPNRPLQLVYNVFGVAAGGPLKHDRVFLFFNYEGQRQAIGGAGFAVFGRRKHSKGVTPLQFQFRNNNSPIRYLYPDSRMI